MTGPNLILASLLLLIVTSTAFGQVIYTECSLQKTLGDCLKTQCNCIWCNSTDKCFYVDNNSTTVSVHCPAANTMANCPSSTQLFILIVSWMMVVAVAIVVFGCPLLCCVYLVHEYLKEHRISNEDDEAHRPLLHGSVVI